MAVDCPPCDHIHGWNPFPDQCTWFDQNWKCQRQALSMIRVCTVHLHKSKIINSHSLCHYYWILWSKDYIKVPLVSRRACNYVRSNELWKWRHRSHHFPVIDFIFRQCFRFYVTIAQWYDASHTTAKLVEQATIEKFESRHLPSVSTRIVSGKQKPVQKLFQESCWIFHSETLFALKWKGDTWCFC